ncbi:hypothetical protein SEUCBS139899_004443 [Sporothrix eucalyptigena]|uniref:SnoaL-like domain-containing protein n=1 Tax=Sporothrix eucalyptigena TaxID=1812306 RepID=A0ABP0CFC4_9PEZI
MADTAALHQLYRDYYHSPDIDAKAHFFAFDCKQVCRSRPDYAACDKAAIVRLMQETPSLSALTGAEPSTEKPKSFATIRALSPSECSFADNDATVQAAGFTSAAALHEYATRNNWVGLRVDLWDEDDKKEGSLLKVHYWWAFRFGQWVQVLHDILYIGPLDGSQGEGGQHI